MTGRACPSSAQNLLCIPEPCYVPNSSTSHSSSPLASFIFLRQQLSSHPQAFAPALPSSWNSLPMTTTWLTSSPFKPFKAQMLPSH